MSRPPFFFFLPSSASAALAPLAALGALGALGTLGAFGTLGALRPFGTLGALGPFDALGAFDRLGRGLRLFLGLADGDDADDLLGAVQRAHALRQGQVTHVDGVVQRQAGDVELDELGQVLGQTLDLELAHERLEDAALLHADRGARQADGHARLQGLALLELVEIEVHDLAREMVLLEVLHQHLVDTLGQRELHHGVLGDAAERAAELARVDRDRRAASVCP